ncbi:MAG TPA: UbiA family prenyltransferase [Acidimicrobiales bacterium]|nr:UbiA family prenyltransferase [Acidimicrobiales bacterium]
MTARAARVVVMMIRPPVAVVILLFAAIGMAQAGRGDALHPLFTVVPLILAGWFVNATVLNDLGDEAVDRVNLADARGRPLVSGDATRAELQALGRMAAAASVAAALAVNWRVAAVVAGGLLLNVAYSVRPLRLCDRGMLAPLVLPAGFVALPYLVGLLTVQPSVGREDALLLAAMYVTFVGRIMLKDFRDVRGDAMFGKRTFLVRHGREATCRLSAVLWTAGTAGLLLVLPRRPLLVAALAALLGCTLHGLRRLVATSGRVAEQVVIGAIAQTGRGTAILLLAHLTMVGKGWSDPAQALVVVTLTLLYAGLYAATLSEGDRVLAIRPY